MQSTSSGLTDIIEAEKRDVQQAERQARIDRQKHEEAAAQARCEAMRKQAIKEAAAKTTAEPMAVQATDTEANTGQESPEAKQWTSADGLSGPPSAITLSDVAAVLPRKKLPVTKQSSWEHLDDSWCECDPDDELTNSWENLKDKFEAPISDAAWVQIEEMGGKIGLFNPKAGWVQMVGDNDWTLVGNGSTQVRVNSNSEKDLFEACERGDIQWTTQLLAVCAQLPKLVLTFFGDRVA